MTDLIHRHQQKRASAGFSRKQRRSSSISSRGGEHGVALVETAIVLPVLLVMMFGALEFGYLFMHAAATANGAAVGARAGAATARAPVEDARILDQVASRKLALMNARYVVIYKSVAADGKLPAACATGTSVPGSCNSYAVQADGTLVGSESAWPSTSRKPGSDYLGVAILGQHKWLTGMFGNGPTLEDAGVVLLEPKVAEVGPASNAVDANEGPLWGTGTKDKNMPGLGGSYTGWFFNNSDDSEPGAASGGGGGGSL